MNIEEVREYGLSLPFTSERMPFGPDTLSLEIGGKIFCLINLDGKWDFYNLKADPDYSELLREQYRGITPGYHMNKKHWISVRFISDIPDSLQRDLILHAYHQTAGNLSKKIQKELGINELLNYKNV